MIEPRTGRVTTMGSFLPSIGAQAPCTRHCTRCGARLRHHNHDTYCAPCDAIINPWQPPPMRTRKSNECPSCGNLKLRTSKRCRKCADAGIRLDFTGHATL